MNNKKVISVKSVSKDFRLPHEKADSVKNIFVNPFNKGLRKFETQRALRNISFDVIEGEFLGIVGRNGSGKSTLLKIIAGIYQPTKGKVVVRGRLVPFIELGVGFNPELTGRDNVYLSGALMGFSEKEVDTKYNEIVDFAELGRFMDQKLKNYSSGMQVRLAFSVATILAESDILLIDEVLAVGDADFQRKCFEYFKKLKKNNKTVVFVSHDMSAVREYCDKAILIDDSRIIFSGSAEMAAKEYLKLFLPEQYMAELRQAEAVSAKAAAGNKWGAGGLDIQAPILSKKVINNNDSFLEIKYKVIGDSGFSDDINPGFTIKNGQGEPICGTNTDIVTDKSKKNIIDSKNNIIEICWVVPNVFSSGKHTIDVAVLSASDGSTLQWWDDAAEFNVINEYNTPYPVSPDISVSLKVL